MLANRPLTSSIPATRKSNCVTENDPLEPGHDDDQPKKQGEARRTRGIRFSDSEWEEVKKAAKSHDVPIAEFVREKILDAARGRGGTGVDATLASLAPLIERTFRYTWMLATHKRDELIREGRGEELEKMVKAAQELQDSLQANESK